MGTAVYFVILYRVYFRRPIEERVVHALGKTWHVEVSWWHMMSSSNGNIFRVTELMTHDVVIKWEHCPCYWADDTWWRHQMGTFSVLLSWWHMMTSSNGNIFLVNELMTHDDVIKWEHFPCYWADDTWWRHQMGTFSMLLSWWHMMTSSNGNIFHVTELMTHDDVIKWEHFSCYWADDTWWRHQMGTFSMLLALCEGNPPVTGGFPSQRPVSWSFDVFFDLCLSNSWANNQDAGDLRSHHSRYAVTVMISP